MQLRDKSIHRLCQVLKWTGKVQQPMIWPYVDHKVNHPCGTSYGLSGASYDLRIAHDLYLPPNPIWHLKEFASKSYNHEHVLKMFTSIIGTAQPNAQLAHSLEWITIPDNVVGYVIDKSTYARVFVSGLNTLFDPGFQGHAVFEMINLGTDPVRIPAGAPLVQMAFHWLDGKASPYDGKYQGQIGKQGAIFEAAGKMYIDGNGGLK